MYNVLDLRESEVRRMVSQVVDCIENCRKMETPLDYEKVKEYLGITDFSLNLEHELWLVDNVGIDVAVSLAKYKNTWDSIKEERFFCQKLAEATFDFFADQIVDGIFIYPNARVGFRNYDGQLALVHKYLARTFKDEDCSIDYS